MAEKDLGAYKNMNSAKDDMTPDFLKHKSASEELSKSESAATNNIDETSDDLSGAIKRENSFTNSVTGQNKTKGGKKGFFKSKGPIGVAIGAIMLTSGFMLGGQAMRPFALVANLMQNFDTASFSSTARLKTIISTALKGGKTKSTPKLAASLKNSGLDVDTDDAGNIKNLSYTDNIGNKVVVDGSNVDSALKSDVNFTSRVSKAGEYVNNDSYYSSVPKTDAAARIDWQKNRYGDFDTDPEKTNIKNDEEYTKLREEFEDVAEGKNRGVTLVGEEDVYKAEAEVEVEKTENGETYTEIETREIEVKTVVDDNGNSTLKPVDDGIKVINIDKDTLKVDSRAMVDVIDSNSSEASARDALAKHYGEVSGDEVKVKSGVSLDGVKNFSDSASKGATAICLASNIASGIASIVIAKQIMDMINVASGYLEAVQKVQAGDGTGASLHWYENKTNETDKNGDGFWNSTSIASLFGSENSYASKQSVGTANLENILTNGSAAAIALKVGLTVTNWRTCNTARLATNALSFALTVAGAVAALTGPVGLAAITAVAVVNATKSIVIAGVKAATIALVLPKLIEVAAKALVVDAVKDMGTQVAGDYVVGGTEQILSKMGQSVGMAAGTSAKVEEFAHFQDTIIAERAEYDRINLSPFDTSSKYTFLGSIMYSLTSFSILSTGNPFIKTLSATGSVLKNSITNLLPTSSAATYSNVASSIADESDCPLLSLAFASGTSNHCMNYTISDTSTFDITYEDAKNYLCQKGELINCSSTPEPKEGGNLEKYIKYGTMRDVHFGLANSEAMSHLLETGNSVADALIGAIPGVGDIIDVINAKVDNDNACYITGEQFVIGSSCWNSKNGGAEMNRYISTYLELDPLEADLGLIEESTLANYLDKYYAENPLDNSYEGRLARFSGLTKEEVIDTLAYMDYLEYVANYNPSERYAFYEISEEKIHIDADSNLQFDFEEDVVLENAISFADLRTRNFAI